MSVERIEDIKDPRVAGYRDLKDADLRLRRGLFVAEGRTPVRALLAGSPFRPRSVLTTERMLDGLRDVLAAADGAMPVYVATEATLRAVVGFHFHRGCLALGERGPARAPEELIAGARLVVVLEDLTKPDNVGGVFRNAMAFGADAVLLSPGCCDPLYREAVRVSMGGTLRTPFARVEDWPGGLAALRAAAFTIVALTPRAAGGEIGEVRVPDRVALLLGTEGEGLSAGARAAADVEIGIATAPGVDSLNVATASGIALYRIARAMAGR
jgi:tRNA G18 (ribose-2'-O)-methylase SpoU